jgi:hypothetical protein
MAASRHSNRRGAPADATRTPRVDAGHIGKTPRSAATEVGQGPAVRGPSRGAGAGERDASRRSSASSGTRPARARRDASRSSSTGRVPAPPLRAAPASPRRDADATAGAASTRRRRSPPSPGRELAVPRSTSGVTRSAARAPCHAGRSPAVTRQLERAAARGRTPAAQMRQAGQPAAAAARGDASAPARVQRTAGLDPPEPHAARARRRRARAERPSALTGGDLR